MFRPATNSNDHEPPTTCFSLLVSYSALVITLYSHFFIFPGAQAAASMRHHQGSSRGAPPESNMRKFSKWGSINTDSGISLVSNDTMKWPRDTMSTSGSSSSSMRVQRGSVAGSSIPELVPQAASNSTQHFVDPRRYGSNECTLLKILLNLILK